jgi:hypothetical protein
VARPLPDLEPGEEARAVTGASFRGGLIATVKTTFAFGSARVRQHAFDDWKESVEKVDFPTAGPESILAVTDRRLLVYFTTFWTERPKELGGAIDLDRIYQVALKRHGLVLGIAFALTTGDVVEFEAMRGIRLRRFAHAVQRELAERGR